MTAALVIEYVKQHKNNEKIDQALQAHFSIILPFLDNKLNVLIYQYLLHATFYHEEGHLIQQSKRETEDWQNEHENSQSFSLLQHALEQDADTFSAISCASHILQYSVKSFKNEISNEKVTLLVELFLTGYYLYFLSIPSAKKNLYFEENSHPHPVIRILNVVLTCIDYLNKSNQFEELGITVNPITTLKNIIKLGTYIEREIIEKKDTIDFLQELQNNRAEITNYFRKLRNENLGEYFSAIGKWNENYR